MASSSVEETPKQPGQVCFCLLVKLLETRYYARIFLRQAQVYGIQSPTRHKDTAVAETKELSKLRLELAWELADIKRSRAVNRAHGARLLRHTVGVFGFSTWFVGMLHALAATTKGFGNESQFRTAHVGVRK